MPLAGTFFPIARPLSYRDSDATAAVCCHTHAHHGFSSDRHRFRGDARESGGRSPVACTGPAVRVFYYSAHALTATTPRGLYTQVEHGFRRTPSAWRSASPSNRPVRTVRTGAYTRAPSPVHEHRDHHDADGFDTEPDSDAEREAEEQHAAAAAAATTVTTTTAAAVAQPQVAGAGGGAAQPQQQDAGITILGLQAELTVARHALACAEREIHRRDVAAARARRVAAELEVANGVYWHPSRRDGK